jgi:aminopeptidase N
LFGFAAGFPIQAESTHRGRTLRVAGLLPRAELERRFADTERMLDFFERKAGTGLPGRSYTQLLVPGSEAQEKSSFSIIGRDQLDPRLADPKEDWAVAHELAHMWWGNLVTCSSWRDFWLNEGITTFMVAAYKEERWGRADYDREMDLFRARRQRAADAGFDVPLAYGGEYPSLALKRAITYSKGALFMDALRRELGDALFWKGLRAFTVANAGRTVESEDLQRAFDQAAGRDLSPLFRLWVFGGR